MLRLCGSYTEDSVWEQTAVSGCPVRMGPWLEKPEPAGFGGCGRCIWSATEGPRDHVSPERMKVPVSLSTTSHWGLWRICLLERSKAGGS